MPVAEMPSKPTAKSRRPKKQRAIAPVIRPARHPEDAEIVIGLYLELLKSVDAFGMDVMPTRRNAELYYQHLLLPGILAQDPVLLAEVKGEIAGAIFWPEKRTPFELRRRSALGLGVFVYPKFAQRGIGSELRRQAKLILSAKGIEVVDGAVFNSNQAGIESALRNGGKPYGQMLIFETSS